MVSNKEEILSIRIEPVQELLLKAIISEGQEAFQYYSQWLKNIDLDKIDGGSYRLIPMLYKKIVQLEGYDIEDENIGKLKGIYKYYFYKNNLIIHRLLKTLKILHQAGIRIMLLKGIALILASYYKDYGLRPMNDVDIFIDKENIEKTLKLLTQLGWKRYPEGASFHAIALSKNEGYVLDIHRYLSYLCCWENIDSDAWKFARVISFKGIPLHILSPSDQILHNCAHGIKWSTLPSFRWIIDVITIIDTDKNSINWQRLISQSKKRLLSLTLFHALKYVESIASGRVPNWVIEELRQAPVNKNEKMLLSILTKNSGILRSYWAVYSNTNLDKSFLNNLRMFPSYIKTVYGLNNNLKIPGFLVNKIIQKFLLARIRK